MRPERRWDRLVLKTMPLGSPKAQITGGRAACLSQRVEDNAFHLSSAGADPVLSIYSQA
jgi:hypothetical protein